MRASFLFIGNPSRSILWVMDSFVFLMMLETSYSGVWVLGIMGKVLSVLLGDDDAVVLLVAD